MVYDEIREMVDPLYLYRSVVKVHVGLAHIRIQRGQYIRHPCDKYSRFRLGYYTHGELLTRTGGSRMTPSEITIQLR